MHNLQSLWIVINEGDTHHEVGVTHDVVGVAVVGGEEVLSHGRGLVHGPAPRLILEAGIVQFDLQLFADLCKKKIVLCLLLKGQEV